VARVRVAQHAVVDDRQEGRHERDAPGQAPAQDGVGLREHLRRVLGVPCTRLDDEANHRAHRRDLESLAADVSDEHRERASRQPPDAEDVATGDVVADRLVDEPEREALEFGRCVRDEAARERSGDPALVLELERVGDRRRAGRASHCSSASRCSSSASSSGWATLSMPKRRGPRLSGTCANEPTPSPFTQGRKPARSSGRLT